MTFDARDSAGFFDVLSAEGDGGLKHLPCKADVDSPSAAPRTKKESEVLAYFCKGFPMTSISSVTGVALVNVYSITETRATASEHELRRRALKRDTRGGCMTPWKTTQNGYGGWDVTHEARGFVGTFETEAEVEKCIKDHEEHQGYVAIVAGGNGAASGVCE